MRWWIALALGAWLMTSSVADAAITAYLATTGTNNAACGLNVATPCQTYRYLMTGNNACGAAGCEASADADSFINVAPGTYHETFHVPFNGKAGHPVTLRCTGAAGSCIIDGSTVSTACSLMCIVCAVRSCSVNQASYTHVQGFKIVSHGNANAGILWNVWNHVKLKDTTVDFKNNTGPYNIGMIPGSNSFATEVNVSAINCPDGATGCNYGQAGSHLAIVGGNWGPLNNFPKEPNSDCLTLLNVDTFLIDGITAHHCIETLDVGQTTGGPLKNGLMRFLDLAGNAQSLGFGSNALKVSGDIGSLTFDQDNTLVKSVFHTYPGTQNANGLSLNELTRYFNAAYNTQFSNSANQGSHFWMYTEGGGGFGPNQNKDNGAFYNIWSSDAVNGNSQGPVTLEHDRVTVAACPASDPCPLVGNVFDFPNSLTKPCVAWTPTDQPQVIYDCDDFGTTINSNTGAFNAKTEMDFNSRPDPQFVSRNGDVVSNLVLQPTSPLIDAGQPLCRANGGGSGGVITLRCIGTHAGTRGALAWFKQPSDFYDLANDECKSTNATRRADGTNPGCYDFQIEGNCGVRQILSMTATSINFSNPDGCTWADGAMVSYPWTGAAPDVGALEQPPGRATATATANTPTPVATVTATPTSRVTATRR